MLRVDGLMEYHAAHVFSNWWFCYFCLTDWAIGGIIVRGVLSLQRMFLSKYLGNNHKVWPFLLGHCDRETVQFLIWIMIWQIHYMVFIGLSPCPVTVTTRIILFFVGDPEEKNIFTTITGRGNNPVFQHLDAATTINKSTSAISQRHCTISPKPKCHRTWKRQRSGSWRQRYP